MRLKNKPWAKPFIQAHPELIQERPTEETITTIRKKYPHVHIEIGCGKGGFLVKKAQLHPDFYFLGIERALTAIAIAGKKAQQEKVENLSFFFNDFTKLNPLLPDQWVDVIYLNFSDPWPKVRHHKRRLTAPTFLDAYFRILKPQGLIVMKTDNIDLISFSKANFEKKGYVILEYSEPYLHIEPNDVETEYEAEFRVQGLPIYRLVVRKVL